LLSKGLKLVDGARGPPPTPLPAVIMGLPPTKPCGAKLGLGPRADIPTPAPPQEAVAGGAAAAVVVVEAPAPIGAQFTPPVRFVTLGLRLFHSILPGVAPGLILRLPARFMSEASRLSPLMSFSDLTLLLGASTKGLPAAGVGTAAAGAADPPTGAG